jgi:hypothetical protein
VATVQKIQTTAYERQGLIEYEGTPEDLAEWLEAVGGQAVVVASGLLGWGDYKHVVRLADVDGGRLY